MHFYDTNRNEKKNFADLDREPTVRKTCCSRLANTHGDKPCKFSSHFPFGRLHCKKWFQAVTVER